MKEKFQGIELLIFLIVYKLFVKLIDVLSPTSCLIFPDELCVAQGMGWFDDQLNFDASVSPSVFFFKFFKDILLLRKWEVLFCQLCRCTAPTLDHLMPGWLQILTLQVGSHSRLDHLSRSVYICQGRAWLDAWTSWWRKRTRWGWTSAGTRSLMRTRLFLSPCSGYIYTFFSMWTGRSIDNLKVVFDKSTLLWDC